MPKKHSFIFGLSLLACLFNNAAEETAWTLERLFDREKVHTFQLEIEPDDWDTIRYQRRDFATALSEDRKQGERPSPFTKVEAQLTIDDFNWGTVSVRKKGFLGSNDSDRPSIKVDLNDYQPGRSIERLRQLTLNNNKQDRSLMSQFMGYELYHRAGLPAPRIAHAEVIVNGQSLGVYSHVETPKESFLDHLYGESSGSLYEGTVTDFWPDWINSFEAKTSKPQSQRTHSSPH